jgi:hypothetical protein
MKTGLIAFLGAASLVASADAGFTGFVAFSRNVGANTVIDVFAAVTNASDKFLNVYNVVSNGSFVQKAGLSSKTWKPDAANFTSTRSVADDSFMTAGTGAGGYASSLTGGDPNFTGASWNGTPSSLPAETIPTNAGWFTNDPFSADNAAELMSSWAGGYNRTDSFFVASRAGYAAPGNSGGTTYGIWCAHLVVTNMNRQIGYNFSFRASASIKDGVNGAVTQATYEFVPAPGALGLLAVAGIAGARRRRD